MHMSQLEGIPISPGYANGIAVVYDYEIKCRLELPHRAINWCDDRNTCGFVCFGRDS